MEKVLRGSFLQTIVLLALLAVPTQLNAKVVFNETGISQSCDCWECEYYCWGTPESPTEPPGCPTSEPCPSCPTPPTIPTTPSTPRPSTTTQRPCPETPTFSKNIYQTSVPTWPIAGTVLSLGIQASTPSELPLSYSLVSSFDFISLSPTTHDIIFTSTISDGAFVGPNNVMLFEVVAEVVDSGAGNGTGSSSSSAAAVAIVFPRPRSPTNDTRTGN